MRALIANPASGRASLPVLESLHREAIQLGVNCLLSEAPGHAELLARQAVREGYDTIIAAGGDDTVREVASALYGGNARLGIIPMGTCNNVAASLGLPADPVAALRAAAVGQVEPMDVGQILGGGLFIESASVGLTAEAWRRGVGGPLGSLLDRCVTSLRATLGAILDHRPLQLEVALDGMVFSLEADDVTVANLPLVGPRLSVAPGASPRDGLLDVCILCAETRLAMLSAMGNCLRAQECPSMLYLKAERLTVRSTEPMVLRVDNTVHEGHRELVFQCRPGHLQVRQPGVAAATLAA